MCCAPSICFMPPPLGYLTPTCRVHGGWTGASVVVISMGDIQFRDHLPSLHNCVTRVNPRFGATMTVWYLRGHVVFQVVVNDPGRDQNKAKPKRERLCRTVRAKPPRRAGLQEPRPGRRHGARPRPGQRRGLPGAQLLVAQPLPPQGEDLLATEADIRARLARHVGEGCRRRWW